MFPYHVDLSELPFQVGGDLYAVSTRQGYTILRNRKAIDGIVVLEQGVGILAFGTLFLEEDEDCLTSLEHAQAWVREHRPALPCPYEDLADCWLLASETVPADTCDVWVLADGKKGKACYQKEAGAFLSADGHPLEHVTEWTENPEAETHRSILEVQDEDRVEPLPEHLQEIID